MDAHACKIGLVAVSVAGLLFPGFGDVASQGRRPGRDLALVGGTVYPSPTVSPIAPGVILIRDGKIAAVGPAASTAIPKDVPTLNCAGLAVTAGFWNSHVHFMERKWADADRIPGPELEGQLEAMLTRFGFTSVWDTGSPWRTTKVIRDRIESGQVRGPRIRSTGEPLFPKGSFPPAQKELQSASADALGFIRYDPQEIGGAADGAAAARQHLDAGTDGVKVYAAIYFPPFSAMSSAAIDSVVKEAHGRGKLAFGHPTTREGLLSAVRARVDVILHTTPAAGPWDEPVLSAMRQARVALVPTLKLFAYEVRHDRASEAKELTKTAVGQLRAWSVSGGTTLFGTDVGYMSEYDPADEYGRMAEAGLTFNQILASLTTAPSERFGESTRLGRIAPGLTADLVVLARDPNRDPQAFAAVRYTIRDGALIYKNP